MKSFIPALSLLPLLAFGVAGAQTPLTEFEVRALLDSEGFSRVDDVDYEIDRGLWEAEVVTVDGDEIAVHVDPLTGRILFGDGTPYVSSMAAPGAVVVPAPRTVTVPVPRTVTVPVPVQVAPVDAVEVRNILVDAGFNSIHDVEFDDGRWRAEVRDATGEDFEVEIDPLDGRIVHLEDD